MLNNKTNSWWISFVLISMFILIFNLHITIFREGRKYIKVCFYLFWQDIMLNYLIIIKFSAATPINPILPLWRHTVCNPLKQPLEPQFISGEYNEVRYLLYVSLWGHNDEVLKAYHQPILPTTNYVDCLKKWISLQLIPIHI